MPAPWLQKLGGLFSSPQIAGGVMGEDPAAMAYDPRMAMASELLSQSGYAPYKRPFGEVLGRAMQAAQQARALGIDREQQRKVQEAQIAASNAQAANANREVVQPGATLVENGKPVYTAPAKDLGDSGKPGSLQELDAINRDRATRGLPPMRPEEYLEQRRGTSADQQAYNQYLSDLPEGKTALPFDEYIANFKGRTAGAQQLGEVGMKRLDAQYDSASQARAALNTIGEAESLLDAGIRTGTAATQRNAVARTLDTVLGRQTDEEALSANTDAYIANAGQLVGQAIKAFGAGTGLSDTDREFATRMAGGSVQVTEATLRKVLAIQRKVQTNVISRYNSQYDRLSPRYGEVADFYERIDIPTSSPRGGIPHGGDEDAAPTSGNDPLGIR